MELLVLGVEDAEFAEEEELRKDGAVILDVLDSKDLHEALVHLLTDLGQLERDLGWALGLLKYAVDHELFGLGPELAALVLLDEELLDFFVLFGGADLLNFGVESEFGGLFLVLLREGGLV